MSPDVAGNFSAAGGVTHVNGVLQVKLLGEGGEIVGIGVHVVAIPGLGGTAMPATVSCNHSIALLSEEHHLRVPIVCGQRPSVTEHDGLARSPVLVVNLRSVFCGNRRHSPFSLRCCDLY